MRSKGVYIFRDGGVVRSSVPDYLLFSRQRWINTDDLACVFAYTSMCICVRFLTDSRG